MKTKVIKNRESPLGRKDWNGRTPRWRPTWFLSKFLILKEIFEFWFVYHPETKNSPEYLSLYDEICGITQKMQTPLMETINKSDLF